MNSMYRVTRWVARFVYDAYRPLADMECQAEWVGVEAGTFARDACEKALRIIGACNRHLYG